MLDEAGYAKGGKQIAITQPRRIGAISLARRPIPVSPTTDGVETFQRKTWWVDLVVADRARTLAPVFR